MGHATISLEDDPSGAVACKLVFTGSFNNASGAHQAAQILIAQMDALMERKGSAVIDPLVIEAESRPIEPSQGERAVAALMALKAASETMNRAKQELCEATMSCSLPAKAKSEAQN